jgi:hypothetical protein
MMISVIFAIYLHCGLNWGHQVKMIGIQEELCHVRMTSIRSPAGSVKSAKVWPLSELPRRLNSAFSSISRKSKPATAASNNPSIQLTNWKFRFSQLIKLRTICEEQASELGEIVA